MFGRPRAVAIIHIHTINQNNQCAYVANIVSVAFNLNVYAPIWVNQVGATNQSTNIIINTQNDPSPASDLSPSAQSLAYPKCSGVLSSNELRWLRWLGLSAAGRVALPFERLTWPPILWCVFARAIVGGQFVSRPVIRQPR